MASDANGWPDPARPGYPANPERDGWHWLKRPEDLRPFPAETDHQPELAL